MKVGDLVQSPEGLIGIVERIDKDFYGARQAFKIYKEIPRGKCIRGDQVDGYGPTVNGISDRILAMWSDMSTPTYEKSDQIEVITNVE